MDPREEGIYPKWEHNVLTDQLEQVPLELLIERVAGDGSVESFRITRDEAFILGVFLSVTFRSSSNKVSPAMRGIIGDDSKNRS